MPPDASRSPLGDFLRASRSRLTPEQAGLTLYGDRRRVAGLRREELAMLAGVSASYYTRLEQGQSRHASPEVLDAISSALHLDDAERAHLRSLAATGQRRTVRRTPPTEKPDPALLELLSCLDGIPALVLGRRTDVLAWNSLGHALVAPHLAEDAPQDPGTRPNMASLVFLDDETRNLYRDWPAKARAVVGNLRLTVGAHPEDPLLAGLIGTLSMASTEFSSLWADQRVQACATAVYGMRHPLIGELAVTQQTLRAVESPDQVLVTHTAPADSSSAQALTLLAHVARSPALDGRPEDHRGRDRRQQAERRQ